MVTNELDIDNKLIKSCPFCGYSAEFKRVGVSGWTIRCSNKGCYAELAAYANPETALINWNRRAYSEEDF